MASTTLAGTTGNDILKAPGSVTALVAGYQGNDTITLTLAADSANAGSGDDSITLADGAALNDINAGSGNDSIFALTATTTIGGSLGLNEGDDSFLNTANIQFASASVGGNAGNDTISLGSGGVLNSTIGGGKNSDSILLASGTVTNSQVLGGGGKDTINLAGAAAAMTLSTINAGDGHDKVLATGLLGASSNIIALGKGYDSISLGTGLYGSIAGGSLGDTITYKGDLGVAAQIFGDGLGDKTGSTSTIGGGDLLSNTYNVVAAASIYGAAGADTVLFDNINAAAVIDGGIGADLIGNTAMSLTGTNATLNGGDGADTIKFDQGQTAVTSASVVLGGAGHDSIYMLSAGSLSVNGGAGLDTLQMAYSAGTGKMTALATLNGGAGADRLHVGNFVGAGIVVGYTSLSMAGGAANVVYQSGDEVFITLTANVTAANFNANNQIWVATSIAEIGGSVNAIATAGGAVDYGLLYGNDGQKTCINTPLTAGADGVVGSVGVYDGGDDMVLGIVGATTKMTYINIIGGGDLIKTTVTTANVAQGTSNFGFSISTTTTGFTISFT